ncbi:MAG: hypothetical protein EOO39_01400 [Cytophagaceae bacterium]|nr:MAG: hypothetical protein EOO39_01400 [Cytophagaceae bacterium]
MQAPSIKPTCGRIVHFVPTPGQPEAANGAKVIPAMVIQVWGDGSLANLRCFPDSTENPTWRPSAKYSEAKEPGTWHWPARE